MSQYHVIASTTENTVVTSQIFLCKCYHHAHEIMVLQTYSQHNCRTSGLKFALGQHVLCILQQNGYAYADVMFL